MELAADGVMFTFEDDTQAETAWFTGGQKYNIEWVLGGNMCLHACKHVHIPEARALTTPILLAPPILTVQRHSSVYRLGLLTHHSLVPL